MVMGWLVEPELLFRDTAGGTLPDGTSTTTAVEVPPAGGVVVVRLTDDDMFTVALAEPDAAHMLAAARSGEISYVSARHRDCLRVLLGVRPLVVDDAESVPDSTVGVPLALYLALPDHPLCEVALDAEQAAAFVGHLEAGLRLIGPVTLGE